MLSVSMKSSHTSALKQYDNFRLFGATFDTAKTIANYRIKKTAGLNRFQKLSSPIKPIQNIDSLKSAGLNRNQKPNPKIISNSKLSNLKNADPEKTLPEASRSNFY